jgi:cupin fold WbuC family metalloprotein
MPPIALSKDKRFCRDTGSRSTLSFYCVDPCVMVDDALIDAMCAESARWDRRNVRLCLHSSAGAAYHEMVALEWYGHYFPPHKHFDKGETLHIIDGELGVLGFDDAGNVVFSTVLGRNDCLIASLGPGRWHMTVPMTGTAIYHESKPGPFLGDADRMFATWAPLPEDTDAVARYLDEIRLGLDAE